VKPLESTVLTGLHQWPDEIGHLHESDTRATPGSLDVKGDGQVGLAGADRADEHHVLRVVGELTAGARLALYVVTPWSADQWCMSRVLMTSSFSVRIMRPTTALPVGRPAGAQARSIPQRLRSASQ
jgi:hypothetical protein